MTPRSLISLILKVTGIFFLRDILEAFSNMLSVIVYFPQYSSVKEASYNLGVTLLPFILITLLVWMLIFRTNTLIRIFRIDRGVGDAPLNMNINGIIVLKAAVILSGVWLIINGIPEFFRHAIYYYQERRLYIRMIRPDVSYFVYSIVKILLGGLLIIFNKQIVYLIELASIDKLSLPWPGKKSSPKKKDRQIS